MTKTDLQCPLKIPVWNWNSSSLGRGKRRSRGKNYEHIRSKITLKSSTSTQIPAEKQGLRRKLDSGKVVHMETTEW